MPDPCKVCGGQDCRPRENNSLGVEIQTYSHEGGWTGKSEKLYETFCEAAKAMDELPKDGTTHRVYSALAERS